MSKKTFKKIILTFLILSISFSANAAISVSDGSAFMTKTEFMADINNLSSRVAQLEIGLDGSLDGKVNSYLEQKGFWKPKPQVLNNEGANITNIYPCSVTLSSGKASGMMILADKVLIDNVSNSGMALLNLAFKCNTTLSGTDSKKARWGYWGTRGSGSYYYDSSLMLLANFFERIGTAQRSRVASIVIGSTLGQQQKNETSTSAFSLFIMTPVEETLIPTMFFVSKGSAIDITIEEEYGFSGLTANPSYSSAGSATALGMDISIKDFVIY